MCHLRIVEQTLYHRQRKYPESTRSTNGLGTSTRMQVLVPKLLLGNARLRKLRLAAGRREEPAGFPGSGSRASEAGVPKQELGNEDEENERGRGSTARPNINQDAGAFCP